MSIEEYIEQLENTYKEELETRVIGLAGDAKNDGVVIVYGDGDDLVLFRGAVDDEIEAWRGGRFYIDPETATVVKARRHGPITNNCIETFGSPWYFKTVIPHKEFSIPKKESDKETERGIVLMLSDIKAVC